MLKQRDIVLIPVPFTDLTSQKRRPVGTPLQGGASKLSTIVEADGWIEISGKIESVPEGESVEVTLTY